MLVSETGVNGGYCASRLLGHKGGTYTIGFPQEGEANGNGTVSPGIALPGETLGVLLLWARLWLQ